MVFFMSWSLLGLSTPFSNACLNRSENILEMMLWPTLWINLKIVVELDKQESTTTVQRNADTRSDPITPEVAQTLRLPTFRSRTRSEGTLIEAPKHVIKPASYMIRFIYLFIYLSIYRSTVPSPP